MWRLADLTLRASQAQRTVLGPGLRSSSVSSGSGRISCAPCRELVVPVLGLGERHEHELREADGDVALAQLAQPRPAASDEVGRVGAGVAGAEELDEPFGQLVVRVEDHRAEVLVVDRAAGRGRRVLDRDA